MDEWREDLLVAFLPNLRRWSLWMAHRHSLDPEDAYGEACLGATRAAVRYDPARGSFGDVALLLARGAILDAMRRDDGRSRGIRNDYISIRRCEASTGHTLSVDELAERLGWPRQRIDVCLALSRPVMRLDGPNPAGGLMVDDLAAPAVVSIVDRVGLRQAISGLPWTQRQIMGLVLEGHDQAEIAAQLYYSEWYVASRIQQALIQMRKFMDPWSGGTDV